MTKLTGDLALSLLLPDGAAGCFHRMTDNSAECQAARLFVRRHRPTEVTKLLRYDLAVPPRTVAGDRSVVAKISQQLLAIPMPGPFLELEPKSVHLFVKEPLRIDVAG